jgi:hypothetical protein
MSQENVEIVRRVSDAYNRGDVGAMLDELHPEIEWHPWLQLQFGGGATVYRGHQGVRKGENWRKPSLRSRHSKQRFGTLASESSPSVTTGDAATRAAQ